MNTNVDALVAGWKSHFASADREIEWIDAEREVSLYLAPNTLLIGILDALACTSTGETFFGEWKTANPREKKTWKQVWRLNPQSLTYGVLAQSLYPSCRRFTVRKAFKEVGSPTYDHAWFRYEPEELRRWSMELLEIAGEIRQYGYQLNGHWPLNYTHCFQYGVNNACPFFDAACAVGDYEAKPAGSLVKISHLATERRIYEGNVPDNLVVLDATRVKTWLGCRERYRREYVDKIAMPDGEALRIGKEFHEKVGSYYKGLIKSMEVGNG